LPADPGADRRVQGGGTATAVTGIASTSASASFARTASSSSTVAIGPIRTVQVHAERDPEADGECGCEPDPAVEVVRAQGV
jgi:hypothetical protein